ncbi:MAG: methylisocitrate lyase [Pirellula sp.]
MRDKMHNPGEKSNVSFIGETSAGKRFRQALEAEKPLQIAGTINPISALLAQQAGFRAIYLSGAGVANASHGLPDLGVTHLEDVLEDARRITYICQLPLLVDIDTGWGVEGTIERTVREMQRAGVAAVHIEDQVSAKRCGHRPGKQVVSSQEMQARLQAACQARVDPDFVIMARTDALAIEGLKAAIERANDYVAAGADMIFAEAVTSLEDYLTFASEVAVPILANMTEFGKSPLLDISQLRSAGVQMVLYPLSAFRAMNQAAQHVYETIRREGTQASVLSKLQTRDELYELLGYLQAEAKTNLGSTTS